MKKMSMKKIKSRKKLKVEKKRIKLHQEELEKNICRKWNELKEILRPINVAKETFRNVIWNKAEKNLEDESILKSTVKYAVSLLAKKFADKAGEKFDWMFKENGK